MKFRVIRKDKENVDVFIMYDRNTGKYCFVNITHPHVCKCRFNTIKEALNDMINNEEVLSFYEL